MKYGLVAILSLVSSQTYSSARVLGPLKTDYCTNYPEGTRKQPDLWKHCCLVHDMYYWAGGTKEDKNTVDLDFKSCIEKTGAREQATIMYYAVRAGSYSPIKYENKKWNHGWKDGVRQTLSSEDIQLIQVELTGHSYIPAEIKINFINSLYGRLKP